MKKLLFFVCLCIINNTTFSQTYDKLDSLFLGTTLWPEDICYNASLLIPKYYKENKPDSINIVMQYWEDKIEMVEPLTRFKILYAIYNDNFTEEIYDKEIPKYIMSFKDRKENEAISRQPDWIIPYFTFGFGVRYKKYISESFNDFTEQLANQLYQTKVKEGSPEYLLCDLYRCKFNAFTQKIKSDQYEHTYLKYYCDQYADKTARGLEGNFALFTGYWIPLGENKILGNHPQLGLTAGIKISKIICNSSLAVGFLPSKELYSFEYEGELKTSDKFQNSYIGLELGYELLRTNHLEFDLLGGIAWDAIIPVTENVDKGQKAKRIETTNLNTALGFRYYYHKYSSRYIGLQFRYNFVDYKTNMGSDLSGNVASIRLSFGFANDKRKHEIRKMFGHSY